MSVRGRDRVARGNTTRPLSTLGAIVVAAAWVAALVCLSIGLVFVEESRVTTNSAFVGVVAAVTVAFVVAPFMAGRVHRSTRVRNAVAVLGTVGLFVSMGYALWAYSNIGGGP